MKRNSPGIARWLAVICLCSLGFQILAQSAVANARIADPANCGDIAPAGVLLLRPTSITGTPLADLIVVDPATGNELSRIDLPLVDVAFPTAIPGLAIAVSGAELYLINTTTHSAKKISLKGESAQDLTPNPVQFRGTRGTRFMLLGSQSFDRVYLLDLEQGDITNLTATVPVPAPDTPVFISFAAITPDDAHVVMWDGRHVYAAETENPDSARLVDDDAFAFAPDFSPDGKELIYSQSQGPGSGSTLMFESMDGSNQRELRTSKYAMVTLWVPESRKIFIDERTETGAAAGVALLLDVDSGEESELLSYSGSLTSVQLSPDGTSALLGVEMMSSGDWHLANLEAGTVEELPLLSSGRAFPGLYGDTRWSLIVPSTESAGPLSGPVYRAVDLKTGAISRLLQLNAQTNYDRPPVLSSDSSLSLVFGQTDTSQTVWLLDAPDLQVWKLAEGTTVDARFSPDDCFVAVMIADGKTSKVVVEPATVEPSELPITEIKNAGFLAWVAE